MSLAFEGKVCMSREWITLIVLQQGSDWNLHMNGSASVNAGSFRDASVCFAHRTRSPGSVRERRPQGGELVDVGVSKAVRDPAK
jgi:hypothetical protein